jgi:hypothetical protein
MSYLRVGLGVSLLLLAACGRHRDHRATASNSRQESATAAQPAPSLTNVASTNAASPASVPPAIVERPSPFTNPPDADRQQIVSTEPAAPKTSSPKKIVSKPLKPFNLASIPQTRDRIATLPAPPLLQNRAPGGASALPFGRKPCCVGTATAEPAKPARLLRALGKVPGLRRLRQAPETEEGFVPAKPARTITMVLPPESRSILPDGNMELKATVNESGGVTRVELLAPKDEELIRLSAYAASDWTFVPARVNDKPVPSDVILHFNFAGK